MKILLLVTGGRGGSDFFQGLLDSHSQILQFPGLFMHENIFQILNLKNTYEISNKFKEVKTSVDKIRNKSVRLENLDVEKKAIDKI